MSIQKRYYSTYSEFVISLSLIAMENEEWFG